MAASEEMAPIIGGGACRRGYASGRSPSLRHAGEHTMESSVCRWGILGTAGIARKNWQAIALSGNSELTAVASRTLDRSRKFVADCQEACPLPRVPSAVEGYGELLGRSDVDAVYIPLPTGVRKEWVVAAADAGKHVLVEKPVGVSADDVREMLAACDRNG